MNNTFRNTDITDTLHTRERERKGKKNRSPNAINFAHEDTLKSCSTCTGATSHPLSPTLFPSATSHTMKQKSTEILGEFFFIHRKVSKIWEYRHHRYTTHQRGRERKER